MTLDDLAKLALIGTARAPALPVDDAEDAALVAALAAVRTGVAEEDLLAAAAVLSAYDACGRPAGVATPPAVAPAEADLRPACSTRADDLLAAVLALPNGTPKQRLALEWLAAASAAGRRVAHARLPALLDYGGSTRAVRDAIAAAVDRRGEWLMAQNDRWQFAAAGADAAAVWSTGSREQRVSVLRRLRVTDAAAARELVASTWKEDTADERGDFLNALEANLTAADQPFLEAALSDRSKNVRGIAANLLARLPESALVQRLRVHAEPLLNGRTGEGGRVVALELVLPPDRFDPAWARDGIEQKPPAGTGPRQWWAEQLLARVPPSVWSEKFGLSPEACVAAAAGDFRGLLLDAWAAAAEAYRDVGWLTALLRETLRQPPDRNPLVQVRLMLIGRLPTDAQHEMIAALLAAPQVSPWLMHCVLDAIPFQLDTASAAGIVAALDRCVAADNTSSYSDVPALLELLAHRVPPQSADAITGSLAAPAWARYRRSLDAFSQTLQLRRDIQTEFSR